MKVAAICVAPAQLNNNVITVVSQPIGVAQAQDNWRIPCSARPGYIAIGGGFDSNDLHILDRHGQHADLQRRRLRARSAHRRLRGARRDGSPTRSATPPSNDVRANDVGVVCAQVAICRAGTLVTVYEFYNTQLEALLPHVERDRGRRPSTAASAGPGLGAHRRQLHRVRRGRRRSGLRRLPLLHLRRQLAFLHGVRRRMRRPQGSEYRAGSTRDCRSASSCRRTAGRVRRAPSRSIASTTTASRIQRFEPSLHDRLPARSRRCRRRAGSTRVWRSARSTIRRASQACS